MIVIANNIPYQQPPTDFREALQDLVAFSARDWSEEPDLAYIYAIVFGWGGDPDDPDDEGCWDSIAEQHRWTPELVERLKEYHRQFEEIGGDHP